MTKEELDEEIEFIHNNRLNKRLLVSHMLSELWLEVKK